MTRCLQRGAFLPTIDWLVVVEEAPSASKLEYIAASSAQSPSWKKTFPWIVTPAGLTHSRMSRASGACRHLSTSTGRIGASSMPERFSNSSIGTGGASSAFLSAGSTLTLSRPNSGFTFSASLSTFCRVKVSPAKTVFSRWTARTLPCCMRSMMSSAASFGKTFLRSR